MQPNATTSPETMTKKGYPSAYGFACGLVQSYESESKIITGNGKFRCHRVELYKEHGLYHIRLVLAGETFTKWNLNEGKQWTSKERLKDAQKVFRHFRALCVSTS